MGKTKITKPEGTTEGAEAKVSATKSAGSKKKVETGTLFVQSTYNNTMLTLADDKGNTLGWSSSGSIGFKGAKKGTPFAAAKIGETLSAKAHAVGMKEVNVVVKGVGSGRESAIRSFVAKGINIISIKDATPTPFNGPRPPKPRRV